MRTKSPYLNSLFMNLLLYFRDIFIFDSELSQSAGASILFKEVDDIRDLFKVIFLI